MPQSQMSKAEQGQPGGVSILGSIGNLEWLQVKYINSLFSSSQENISSESSGKLLTPTLRCHNHFHYPQDHSYQLINVILTATFVRVVGTSIGFLAYLATNATSRRKTPSNFGHIASKFTRYPSISLFIWNKDTECHSETALTPRNFTLKVVHRALPLDGSKHTPSILHMRPCPYPILSPSFC